MGNTRGRLGLGTHHVDIAFGPGESMDHGVQPLVESPADGFLIGPTAFGEAFSRSLGHIGKPHATPVTPVSSVGLASCSTRAGKERSKRTEMAGAIRTLLDGRGPPTPRFRGFSVVLFAECLFAR